MPVFDYRRRGVRLWGIDVWVKTRTGSERIREREIPTQEQAKARLAQAMANAYEGRTFKRTKPSTLTVAKAWTLYEPVAKRNDSYRSDRARSKTLLGHLGRRVASELHQGDVDAYRAIRGGENTKRGAPPSPATLDREVELLKRLLGYAVKCGKMPSNPLAGVSMLKVPNVRDVTVTDGQFEAIIATIKHRSAWMRPVLLLSYDTGMRIGEVCKLLEARMDWDAGLLRLTPQETKSEKGRTVGLQQRTLDALREARVVGSPYLFPARRGYDARHPKPVTLPRAGLKVALEKLGLGHVHPHDLRRSYATLARKRGIPQSVVMKQGGWRTDSVFKRYNIVDEQDVLDAAKVMEQGRTLGQHPAKVDDSQKSDGKKT